MHSIIIPTRNRLESLSSLLSSIEKLTFDTKLFEVIIIDNCEKLSAKAIFNSKLQTIKRLKYYHQPKPGLHQARHLGMKMSKYELLTFLDDDVLLNPLYLTDFFDYLKKDNIALLGGPVLPNFETTPPKWLDKMWKKEKLIGELSLIDLGSKTKEISAYDVFGCNFTIKKSILKRCGGFHPDGMPEELKYLRGDGETHVSKWLEEHNFKAIYHSNAMVKHFVPKNRMTLEYFYKRAFNQGISNSYSQIRKLGLATIKTPHTFSPTYILVSMYNMLLWLLPQAKSQKLQQLRNRGFSDGFSFHQLAVYNDPELQKWILKQNYIDD